LNQKAQKTQHNHHRRSKPEPIQESDNRAEIEFGKEERGSSFFFKILVRSWMLDLHVLLAYLWKTFLKSSEGGEDEVDP